MNSRNVFQQEQQRRLRQEQERRRLAVSQQQPLAPRQSAPPPPEYSTHGVHGVHEVHTGDERQPQAPATRKRVVQPKVEPVSEQVVGLSDEQRNAIQRYIQLDDEIAQLNTQVSRKRAERKELEDEVLGILRPLPAPVSSGNNVLKVKKTQKKESINQKFWENKLAASGELKDPTRASQLVKAIYKNRTTEEDFSLVRETRN